jgi:hypothetical protein
MASFKKLSFSLFVISSLILFIASNSFAEQYPNASGYFTTKKGKTITFTKSNTANFTFLYGPEDKRARDIPLATIKEITFGKDSKVARITFKDGREINAKGIDDRVRWTHSRDNSGTFYYEYFDDINKKEEHSKIGFYEAAKIVVDENIGRFKRCPFCKRNWPDSYLFCPHDGTKTVWGEPAGSIQNSANLSKEQRLQKSGKVMEAIVNESVAKQGGDPSSDLSRKATDFATAWMNPLATKDEINKKLYDLRDAIVK